MDTGAVGVVLTILLVSVGCFFAYYAIGDLIDRRGRQDPEREHRRSRPLAPNDEPAFDPRKYGGDFGETPFGGEPND